MNRFWVATFFCVSMRLSVAQATEEVPVPTSQPKSSIDFLVNSVLKIDESLSSIGLQPLVCQYKASGVATQTFKGLANCLFKNLADSENHIQDRAIKAWFNTPQNKTISAQISWNPNDEGWGSISREVFRLYFEGSLAKLSKNNGHLSFAKSLIGEVQISFSEPLFVHDIFPSSSVTAWTKQIEVSQFNLNVRPTGKTNGLVQYEGEVAIRKSVEQDNGGALTRLRFQTNFNFLKPSRTFDGLASGTADGGLK